MKVSDYKNIASVYLKGHYGEAFIVTTLCLSVLVFFKAITFIMIYAFNDILYANIAETVSIIISFAVMTPLVTGGFWWFFQTVCESDNRNILKLYSGIRLNLRAALLYSLMWIKSFASLIPSALLISGSYILLYMKTDIQADMIVLASFQLLAAGIVFTALYFRVLASMALAPFIFIRHPDRNPFGVLRDSAKMMKGRKIEFLKLMLSFIPLMLPVVTIPFIMPSAAMSAAAFAKESIKEN